MNKTKVIICVDGGGTSTKYAVIDQDKKILLTKKGLPGSPAVNLNACNDIFHDLETLESEIKNLKNLNNNYEIKGIILGLSGFALVDVDNYKKQLEERFKTNIVLENDVYLAWVSVVKCEYDFGTVCVSGTGAACLSINNNQSFMSNGWGQLLTERGSGHTCVRDFVCRMIHHLEEEGKLSNFEQAFLDYCHFKDILDFKPLFYRHSKDEVAKYSLFFIEKAKENNLEAIEWLKYNGKLLGIDIVSSLKRVKMPKEFPLGFRGGFIDQSPWGIEEALKYIQDAGYHPILVDEDDPIDGGYYQALRLKYFD